MNRKVLPKLYRWKGKKSSAWAFGWLSGRDSDLVCVEPKIIRRVAAEMALSPLCSTRFFAISAAIIKMLLLRIDQNYRSLER